VVSSPATSTHTLRGSLEIVRVRRYQIHFTVNEADYSFILRTARDGDETIASLMRRTIRALRRSIESKNGLTHSLRVGASEKELGLERP